MFGLLISKILFAAIPLTGVVGDGLRTRAFFDANNVKVGDPLVLTLDFLGEADFAALHPPALAKAVSRADWKLDDASAKTETYRDARRLTYRVRPMREGVLWFPELEFSYVGSDGKSRGVRSNAIPVHAKRGAAVEVAELHGDEVTMPQPDALVTDFRTDDADLDFAWRKACARPTADAFAAFDFPEAKLNEARCATLAGDWKRALAVYSRLEWRIGQTPAIERGILAALAVRYANPLVELPVWRQVARPVLKYGWKGRILIVAGGALALVFLFWLAGRCIRRLASFAVVFAALACPAQDADPFQQIRRVQRQQMDEMMSLAFGEDGFPSARSAAQPRPKMRASVALSRDDLQVGDEFDYVLSLEVPKGLAIGQVNVVPVNAGDFAVVGRVANLTDGKSANPSNVVRRFSLPVRYDRPYRGRASFQLNVPYQAARTRQSGLFSFFSSSLLNAKVQTPAVEVNVKPLPKEGQPADFSGIIATRLTLTETTDLRKVETNDVIRITYRMSFDGHLPEGWMPPGAAFEWGREGDVAEWRRFFVADGTATTPKGEVVWYDAKRRAYRREPFGGTPIGYFTEK